MPVKQHHHAMFVGRIDHFLIAHRAAGLNDDLNAVLLRDINAVAEREEGFRGHRRAVQIRLASAAF